MIQYLSSQNDFYIYFLKKFFCLRCFNILTNNNNITYLIIRTAILLFPFSKSCFFTFSASFLRTFTHFITGKKKEEFIKVRIRAIGKDFLYTKALHRLILVANTKDLRTSLINNIALSIIMQIKM